MKLKRPRDMLIGVGLLTSLTLGTYAGDAAPHYAEGAYAPVTVDYSARLKLLAGSIISLAPRVPDHYEGKPPHSVGFTVPTENSGTVYVQTQTSGKNMDAAHVVMVDVQQDVSSGRSFDISFYKRTDDTWNAICTNNVSVTGAGIAEVGQQTAYAGNKEVLMDPAMADAILSTEITAADTVVNAIAAHALNKPMPPFPDMCAFNLG